MLLLLYLLRLGYKLFFTLYSNIYLLLKQLKENQIGMANTLRVRFLAVPQCIYSVKKTSSPTPISCQIFLAFDVTIKRTRLYLLPVFIFQF